MLARARLFLCFWFARTPSRLFYWIASTVLLIAGASFARAQQPLQALHRHVRPEIANGSAPYVGALDPESTLNFSIVLTLRNQDELTSLLGRLYDPTSPDYHHFLSVADFTDRFAPSATDYQAVVAFAQANGLTVTSTPANRLVVPLSGTVAQINQALHVTMAEYRHPTEDRNFFSPNREPSIALGVPIAHISGLDSFSTPHPHVMRPQETTARAFFTNGSGPGGSYLASDMRTAYYGNGTLNGAGQAVGLPEFDGYNLSDVNLTFSNAGQSYGVPINNVLLDGATGGPVSGAEAEVVLDIVQAIGMAPGLSQVRVYIGSGLDDANILNSMASENIAKQLSCSWGWRPADPATDDVFFEEFAAQGQSFFTASGDYGAFDAAISPFFYPAEDAYVTTVGGTHLSTSPTDGSWVSETAWNSNGGGSGGGISPDGIAIPSWQTSAINVSNAGSTTLRNVPDVAMEGDFDNYVCTLGSCYGDFAGTSFAAPRWAGFAALVNQQAVEAGTAPAGGIGFLNPAIYQISGGANYASDFHDVTVGNNDTGNQPVWYTAVTGYDLVTGLGSTTGQSLINDLAGPQVPGFWIYSSTGTIAVDQGASSTATFSVTGAGGFSGNVTLAVTSSLPSGVTASWGTNPTSGSSVLTVTASSMATAGTVTLTITGTSGSLTATTNVKLAIHGPTFLLTPSPSSVTVSQGGTVTSTIVVTPQYGFSGNVNLSVSGLPSGVTASWSANPTASSSILTLTASSTAAGGPANLTITGTSGNLTVTSNLYVTVYAPTFAVDSGPVSMGQGTTSSSNVYVVPEYGFSGAVNLSISGLPSGVTASFSPNPTIGSSLLTLTASSSAAIGQYSLTITGVSGSITQSAVVPLGIYAPTFTLSTSSPVNIGQGNSITGTVYVQDQFGFSSNVNLAISGLPSGVTASMVPNPTTYSTAIAFTAAGSAAVGQYPLTITGTSGSLTRTTTLTLGVYAPTFTIGGPSSLVLGQGATINNNVTVNPLYGFTGSVNLSLSGLPSGVTASFLPNPTSGNSTFTLTASNSAAVGQYPITIKGAYGSQSATASFTLTIAAPAFTLSSSSVTVGQGAAATGTVNIYSQNGFTGSVNLSVSGLPSGVTASFSPNPATSANSSTLTLTAGSSAPPGQYTLTVTGASGSLTASTTASLTIGAPAFTLSAPATINLGQGASSANNYIYIAPAYGFSGNVSFAISGLPTGITASLSPNPSVGSNSPSLTLTASSSAAAGQYTITVTGTSGSLIASTTFRLVVGPPSFTISGSTAVTVGQGSNGSGSFYVTGQYGFNANVNLTVTGLPTGVTATFSPNPTAYSSTLTLTATSSVAVGQYPLTIQGASGSQTASTNLMLSVIAPTFTLGAPGGVNVGQGASSSSSISINSQSGFTGSVNLAVSGLPSGVTASFSPNPTAGSSTLTFTATSSAALGQYPITITGTSGTQTAATITTLTVYTSVFTLSSSSANVGQGHSAATYVTIGSTYGFIGNVNLSVSGLPSGVTASFSPNPATSSSTITFNATSSASLGQFPITITGTSGTQTVTTSTVLSVYAPTFTLSGAYGVVNVGQGASATTSISVNQQYGFTGYVNLSVSGLPSGVTASFSPNPVTTGSTITLTASSTAALGQYTVLITGTSGNQTATTPLTIGIYTPAFTLYSYNSVSMGQGTSATTYVNVQAQYSFNGAVNLAVSGLPSGVTASFSPNPTTTSSTLTFTASSSAALGQCIVTIVGTYGSFTSTTTIPLTISTPVFALSGPTNISIGQGNSTSTYISINPQYGFNSGVNLSVSGLTSGVTASFSPNPTTGSSMLTLTASSSAALGQYPFTITGTSGARTSTLNTVLSVYAPTFTISGSSSFTLGQGASTSGYFYVTPSYGFSGSVNFSVAGLPSGVTASFSPNPTTYSTTLTLTATGAAPLGQYSLIISGTLGAQTVTIPVSLVVAAPAFTISANSSVGIGQGSSQSTYLYVQSANGFNGNVTFSISGLPSGVTASFSPNPTTYGTNLTLTAAGTAALGPYNVTITGTSGSLTAAAPLVVQVYPPGFYLSGYSSVTLNQGGSGTGTVYISGQYGFNGPVILSASNLPSGVTASFSPNPATSTATVTFSASANATPGSAIVTITGASAGATASTTLNLIVNASAFALADAPSQTMLVPGASTKALVSVVPFNGFAGSVNLSIAGLPAGVTAGFSTTSTTSTSILTLTASPSAAVGTAIATITGISGSETATQPLQVTVGAAPTTTTTLAISAAGNAVTSIASGTPVTLTAAVASGATPLTAGQVIFCNAAASRCGPGSMLGSAQLTSTGTATFTFIPGMGSHSYVAVFTGTNAAAGSSSAASRLSVASAQSTSTVIAQSGPPGAYSLTATVSGQGPIAPDGSVSFLDTSNSNYVLGTATLSPGLAVFSSTSSSIPLTGTSPSSVAVGDFNGDGIPDLAVVNALNPGGILILLGRGDGTFTPGTPLTPSGTSLVVVAADLNRDGKLDLVVGSTNSLLIFLGNGDGTFTSTAFNPQMSSSVASIAVGDLNADGILDLAVVGPNANLVNVLLGNGDGTFTAAVANPATGSVPHSVVIGDFNGDGMADLAVANEYSNSVSILLGNGDGTFTSAASSPATGSYPASVAVGDFNGDGIQDLAVANEQSNTVTVLLGNGDGTFTPSSSAPSTGSYPISVAVGDFNNDGIQDLAVANYYGTSATILLGKGNVVFTAASTSATGLYPTNIVAADLDGDGIPDLVTANIAGSVTVLPSKLAQTATATVGNISPVGTGIHAVDANYPGGSYFRSSTSNTTQITGQTVMPSVSVTPSTSSISGAQALAVTVAVSGGSGNPIATGSVLLTAGAYTSAATALSNGSVIVMIPAGTLAKGTDTLTVVYTPDTAGSVNYTSAAGSSSVTVGYTTPVITVTPSSPSITALQSLNVSVAVSGGTGNPVPTGSVVLSSGSYTSAAATLSAGSASIAIPAGSLPAGADSLVVTYTPDNSAANTYNPGTGTGSVTVTKVMPAVTVTPAASTISTAQGLSVTVTLNAGVGNPVPSGSVILASGAYTSPVATLTGSGATISIPAGSLAAGTDSLSVAYTPDSASAPIYNMAIGSSSVTVVVGAPASITATPSAAIITNRQTDTIAVSVSGTSGQPTGVVTLTSGTYTAQQTLSNGAASFSIPAGTFSAGPDTLTISYSGSSVYNIATATASVTVAPVVASASAPAPAAVNPGSSATSTLTLSAGSNYSGTMSLSCTLTTSPQGAQNSPTCVLGTPSVQLSASGSGTDSITFNTTAASSASAEPPSHLDKRGASYAVAIALTLMFGWPRRRRRPSLWMLLVLLSGISLCAIGCGGGSSGGGTTGGGGGGGSKTPGTTAGVYTFTLTGVDSANSATTASTSLTLTVQ